MKLHTIVSVAIAVAASPRTAPTHMAKSTSVPAGSLTVAEQAHLRFAMEDGSGDGNAIKIRELRQRAANSVMVTRTAK